MRKYKRFMTVIIVMMLIISILQIECVYAAESEQLNETEKIQSVGYDKPEKNYDEVISGDAFDASLNSYAQEGFWLAGSAYGDPYDRALGYNDQLFFNYNYPSMNTSGGNYYVYLEFFDASTGEIYHRNTFINENHGWIGISCHLLESKRIGAKIKIYGSWVLDECKLYIDYKIPYLHTWTATSWQVTDKNKTNRFEVGSNDDVYLHYNFEYCTYIGIKSVKITVRKKSSGNVICTKTQYNKTGGYFIIDMKNQALGDYTITTDIYCDVFPNGKTTLTDTFTRYKNLSITVSTGDNSKLRIQQNDGVYVGVGKAAVNENEIVVENKTNDALIGDVNNDKKVNRTDLARFKQFFAGWNVEINEAASDINGDGQINRKDLSRFAQYFAGWNVKLGS